MDPELARASELIEAAIAGLSPAELAWHKEGKWSAAQILEHLSLAFSGTVKGCRKLLDTGKPDCRKITAKDRVSVAVVVKLGYFPPGRKAPKGVLPQGLPSMDAVQGIRENLAKMDPLLAECEQKFGPRTKIMNHPVLGPLTPPEWRKFHYVHTRHHMRQIQTMRPQMQERAQSASV